MLCYFKNIKFCFGAEMHRDPVWELHGAAISAATAGGSSLMLCSNSLQIAVGWLNECFLLAAAAARAILMSFAAGHPMAALTLIIFPLDSF